MKQAIVLTLTMLALGCITSSPAAAPATQARPTLKLLKRDPLTVRGSNFQARERVRVSAAGRRWRLLATARGGFVVVLHGLDRCNSVRVLAVGDEGSRTILKILASPACPPTSVP